MRRLLRALLLAVLLPFAAHADTYPANPIKLITPFPPGGSNDLVGRMIAAQLSARLEQPVVVENQGGAGGLIGTELAAKAPPDGYTLLLISVAYAFNPSIYKLPYDPATAFAPVAMLGSGPVVIAVTSKLPVDSVRDLIKLAKSKPGELNYATAGVGSFQHLASELFKQQAGIDMVHVPFKGGGPAMMDVIAGNTQVAVGSLIQMLPQIKGGRLKALGVGSAARIPALPDVPTISESAIPGFEVTNCCGIVAPAGATPSWMMAEARAWMMCMPSTRSVAASATIFTKPTGSSIPSARPLIENGNWPVFTAIPSAFACCSLLPTQAISGEV